MSTYAVADDVAWVSSDELDVDDEPTAYVTRLPRGPAIVLRGSACVGWLAVVDGGTLADVVRRASELAGVALEDVEHDTARLLDELVGAGVLRLA